MDDLTKRRAAYRGFYSEDEKTDYFLYLAGDEVLLVQQWEIDEATESAEMHMSVTNLKRLVRAAKALLKMSGNDAPLPLPGRPETDQGEAI